MAILGLDHVQLAIPEGGEPQVRAFFTGILGMREVAKPASLSPSGCWFEAGSLSLHIGVDPDFRPATRAHPALLVDDLDALETRLQDAGHAVEHDDRIEGFRRFFTADPFGNRIEIMQKKHP